MKVFVIIVTYNGIKWIEECLISILNSSVSVEIIVIDNCSIDGTVECVKSNFKKIILLEQNQNLGFGKANNIGMSLAIKKAADYVFLLNQDAFVMPDTIENLIEASQQNLSYGVISPIQLDYSGKFLEYYFLKFMATEKTKSFYSDYILKNDIKKIYQTDFVQAAAWLLPIGTLKKIGGFDPIFFHYGEDDNYCQRLIFHKLKIGVASNIFVRHDATRHHDKTIEQFSEKYYKLYEKQICLTYANINMPFDIVKIEKQLKILYLKGLVSAIKFNLKEVKGFYKKVKILNSLKSKILQSRANNSKIYAHYLDV